MNRAIKHRWTLTARPSRLRERGSAFVEGAVVAIVILIPLLLGVIDFGRAYFVSIEVANAAKAGAALGESTGVLTPAGLTAMSTAAQHEAPDIASSCPVSTGACWVSGYPLAQWGCECSNSTTGTGTDSCSLSLGSCNHLVNFVVVTTKATYTPLFNFYGLFPTLTLSAQSKLRLSVQ